jgi:hypothetical protein
MTRKLILLTVLFLANLTIHAQSGFKIRDKDGKIVEERLVDLSHACKKDSVFAILSKQPEFKNGTNALIDSLNSKITIDPKLKCNIYIMFLVNCNGNASGFVTSDTKNVTLSSDIINVLKSLQFWIPAELQNKERVDCYKNLFVEIKKGKIMYSK